jgi:hypothetical protein
MKLPNGDNAVIDQRKLSDYCLSAEHDEGKHKANLFRELLGLTLADIDRLYAALQRAALHGEATPGRADRYGQRYTIDFVMAGRGRTVVVRSAWIVRTGEVVPRLVTCYIM